MTTLNIQSAALDRTARQIETTGANRSGLRIVQNDTRGSAIERQLDEIQHTFSVRWEW
jgi:hypothetical protein